MHIRVPFLAVLIISFFQLAVYAIQNNEYSTKDFDEIYTVQSADISEMSMIYLSGEVRSTRDPDLIQSFLNFFDQFQYKRLMNDQTAFMPRRTVMIRFFTKDDVDFFIPYGKELLLSHKVYSIKGGQFDQDMLLALFQRLPQKDENATSSP